MTFPNRLQKTLVTLGAFGISFAAAGADPAPIAKAPMRAASSNAQVVIPMVNWTVPQFFGAPAGVTSSMASSFAATAGRTTTKNDLGMSVFKALAPCRLVDTRGLYSPVYGSGGPFATNEIRTYSVQGNCGIPVGANRVKAVSIAITTLPSDVSGDIETVAHGAPLGNTVDMVVQTPLWNSVSKIVRVDANGEFDMQVRYTHGHLAIDINGYFADTITGDFYSVNGDYGSDGGLFYSQNSNAVGAAVRAYNPGLGSDVRLAQGANALDIASGQIRVRGAGNNTSTPAFIHQVSAQNLCPDTHYTRLEESHVFPALAGQLLFVQEAAHTGSVDTSVPKLIRAVFITSGTCNTLVQSSWFLYTNGAFALGETYNVLVISP